MINRLKENIGVVVAVVLAISAIFLATSALSQSVRHFPVGQHCWDAAMLPVTEEMTTISKTTDEWVIDDPTEGVIVTLNAAPESVKPEEFKGRPGWCLVKMESKGDDV